MPVTLIYPSAGRGAWSGTGKGGTLNFRGDGPGRFFRAAASANVPMVGHLGYTANRNGTAVSIDAYAVFRAALAIQTALRVETFDPGAIDGVWGPRTDQAVKAFQGRRGLTADGVFGPQTSRSLFEPMVHSAAGEADPAHALTVARIMVGTIQLESVWDPAAVGTGDSHDLGLAQINGPAHPTLSPNDSLNPRMALPWMARFVDSNLEAFDYSERDAVVAYNLGPAGARTWIRAGRPDLYTPPGSSQPRNVRAYIDRILNPPS